MLSCLTRERFRMEKTGVPSALVSPLQSQWPSIIFGCALGSTGQNEQGSGGQSQVRPGKDQGTARRNFDGLDGCHELGDRLQPRRAWRQDSATHGTSDFRWWVVVAKAAMVQQLPIRRLDRPSDGTNTTSQSQASVLSQGQGRAKGARQVPARP